VPDHPIPLAYLITYHTYGTWLHGNEDGSVDDEHNIPGTPMLPPDPARMARERALMDQPEYILDAPRREVVLSTIQEVCEYRTWPLLAAHVRSTHVHVVVHAQAAPERVMSDFKTYASRHLTEAGFETRERKRWTRHGSTRYLWKPEHVEAAIHYVVRKQGTPMAVYENKARIVSYAPLTFENAVQEQGVPYVAVSWDEIPEYVIYDTDDIDDSEPSA
jgi:REP element-mobilizing transposase RayT